MNIPKFRVEYTARGLIMLRIYRQHENKINV